MNSILDQHTEKLHETVQKSGAELNDVVNELGQLKLDNKVIRKVKRYRTEMIKSSNTTKLENLISHMRAHAKIINEQTRSRLKIKQKCIEANVEIAQVKMKYDVIMSLKAI